MQQELVALHTETQNKIIEKMKIENDEKKFWTRIRKLQGNEGKTKATNIKDHNDHKIYDDTGKETIFKL